MKMRAAVLEEFGRPLQVQELDLAEPKEGDVRRIHGHARDPAGGRLARRARGRGLRVRLRAFDLMHDQDGIRSVIDFH